jgi:hypothetical protein
VGGGGGGSFVEAIAKLAPRLFKQPTLFKKIVNCFIDLM